MKYVYSIIIAIFIFSSCVTTNFITLDIREPATVSFPPEVTNVIIVDNSMSEKDNNEEEGIGIMSTDSAKTILLNSLQQFMNEENYFSKVELYPYKIYKGHTGEIIPLSKRKVESICKEKGANALISLDFFAISAQLETENVAYFSNYSIMSAKLGTILRTYSDKGAEYGKPLGYIDSLFRGGETDWSRINRNIPEINSLVSEISVLGADKITGHFIPSWKTKERWYYSDNSAEMKKAVKSVNEGQWQQAADIWGKLYEKEEKTTKKIRLASNIALANESLDDIENAVNWINIAFDLLPKKSKSELAIQVAIYQSELTIRKVNMQRLNQQLGIEDPKE